MPSIYLKIAIFFNCRYTLNMLDESENVPDTDPAAHIKSLSRQVDLLTELSSAG